jgi:hypothetical protein
MRWLAHREEAASRELQRTPIRELSPNLGDWVEPSDSRGLAASDKEEPGGLLEPGLACNVIRLPRQTCQQTPEQTAARPAVLVAFDLRDRHYDPAARRERAKVKRYRTVACVVIGATAEAEAPRLMLRAGGSSVQALDRATVDSIVGVQNAERVALECRATREAGLHSGLRYGRH